uniref:Thioredoxin domain-containing protein n=1 Tax=Ditylum brightwellii TaxID=49249 RepID=A0A7S1Z9V0_9STRA|mmetsp:Transcript_2762/g.4244  ORF Transcript_2762/g.4244 Transcript_2762/m.4244 type:complete len:312 (+) Transcript_2762:123-1058(+)
MLGASRSAASRSCYRMSTRRGKQWQGRRGMNTSQRSVKEAKSRAGTGNIEVVEGTGEGSGGFSMMPRGPVSWPALGLVAVVAASAVSYYKIERERRLEEAMGKIVSSESGWSPNPEFFAERQFKKTKWGWFPVEDAFGGAGKPAIGGPWSLIDLDGNLVTNRTFEGKWTLLYFGFARCPDICPSEMVKIGKVMDTLKAKYPSLHGQIQPIFVSVDPARDSLKALKEYGKDFHPSYVFLTGSPEQVQQMAKKYRVYVSKADETEDGDYLVDHSIVVYFHDDTGDLSDCFTQSMRPSDVVEKVVERMTFVPSY